MIKSPNVADQFYPGDKQQLTQMLDGFFANIKKEKKFKNLKAIVAPHAGYIYSGQVAAYSYQVLKEHLEEIKDKDITFVIMAPSHYEYFEGVSIGLYDAFETPLGRISVDKELGKKLIDSHPKYFSFNEAAYEQEHALEVQLPFLQYIFHNLESRIQNLKLLPMIFGNTDPIEVGNILYELSQKENVFFIVSSDLSHFMQYENAVQTDEDTLHRFIEKDLQKIADEAEACGIHPRLTLTEIAILGHRKPELIKYLNSGDTAGEKSRVVGYGSVIYHS